MIRACREIPRDRAAAGEDGGLSVGIVCDRGLNRLDNKAQGGPRVRQQKEITDEQGERRAWSDGVIGSARI